MPKPKYTPRHTDHSGRGVLAVNNHVAASTQNQALNALVFFYGQVLKRSLQSFEGFVRSQRPKRMPTVLTRAFDMDTGSSPV